MITQGNAHQNPSRTFWGAWLADSKIFMVAQHAKNSHDTPEKEQDGRACSTQYQFIIKL